MDVRFINPFVRSICNTFETMCSLKTIVGRPFLKTDDNPSADVSGVVGFSGDAVGSVILHFSFESASIVASRFAGVPISPDHSDFSDAIGELANMVAGGAKSQLDGLYTSMSLPNVIVGRNHSFSASKSAPRLIIPCSAPDCDFQVEVAMVVTSRPPSMQQSLLFGVQP